RPDATPHSGVRHPPPHGVSLTPRPSRVGNAFVPDSRTARPGAERTGPGPADRRRPADAALPGRRPALAAGAPVGGAVRVPEPARADALAAARARPPGAP